ncbi:MAG: hypothetical protein ACLUR5_17315 [Eubacterium ventriosum]
MVFRVEDNVQISQEDKEKQFIDYLADLPEDDGTAYIRFLYKGKMIMQSSFLIS